jgi:hypothetical protein
MGKSRVNFSVREIDHGFDKLKHVLKAMRDQGAYVKAGVIGSKGAEVHGSIAGQTITNTDLAAIHEFGAPSVGIPERSFIRSTFEANKQDYISKLRLVVKNVYHGRGTIEAGLKLIGLKIENDIKATVRSGEGVPPPLAQSTIDRKGSSRPLVDTGQMINSVSSAVVLKGDE